MKKLNVGIIGCRKFGPYIVGTIIENPNLELTAVCDLNEKLLKIMPMNLILSITLIIEK